MRRQELKERLPHPPAQTKRTLQVIYDIDSDGKRGQLGHHDYTDKELRLLKEWDRVNALLGAASRFDIKLRRRAVRMLAAAPAGYVWISQGLGRLVAGAAHPNNEARGGVLARTRLD